MFKLKTKPFNFKIKIFFFRKVTIIKNRFTNIFNTFIVFRNKLIKNFKISIKKITYIGDN